MVDNTVALQARVPTAPASPDIATPLLAAAKIKQADSTSRMLEFQLRQAEIGSEARGLLPFVGRPEFGEQWALTADRLANKGLIDPQAHQRIRNNPSPFLLQQFLAQTESAEQNISRQKLAAQQSAVDRHAGSFGLPSVAVPGAIPSGAPAPPMPISPQIDVPPRAKVASSAKVVGDDEGVAAGLYEPPKVAGQAPPAPGKNPSIASPNPASADLMKYVAAASDPYLPESMQKVATEFVKKELENSKYPDDVKKYLFARASGDPEALKQTPTEWIKGMKKASAPLTQVQIDNKGETAFESKFGEAQAKRWNGYIQESGRAEKRLVDIQNMREISRRVGSQGAQAGVKEFLGPYAEAVGVNIEGLPDIQAYSSIIQRLAPQQRAEGSGSTSDIEFKGMLKSLPGLMLNPVAREMTLDTMEALARDDMARGEIASRLATKEITRTQAEKELRALPDPMKGFSDWRKKNPEIYRDAIRMANAPTSFDDRFGSARPSTGGLKWRIVD